MFNACPLPVRLIEDVEGYIRVYDTADWRVVFTDVQDASGQPLSLNGIDLALEIRPQNLPNCVVDSLSLGSGITAVADSDPTKGPTLTITSVATARTWSAREETVLLADLMMRSAGSTTFLTRVHFIVTPGTTRP